MFRVTGLLFAIALGLPGLLGAQSPLTLAQAVAEATAGNRTLSADRSLVEQARSGIQEARSGLLPRITVAETWQRGTQPVFVFSSLLSSRRFAASNFAIDALNHPDPIGFFRTSVGVEQLIFDGGRARAATAAASLRHDISAHGVDQASADLAVSVAEAFGRVLTAQAAQRAARAGIDSAREDLTRAERRRDVGMATDADVLSLRVHLADLEQRSIQSIGEAAIARAELNRLTGAPIAREFAAVEPASSTSTSSLDRAALIAQALAARPLLKARDESVQLADAARRGSRAALIPQVAAQAAFDLSGTTLNDRASSWLVGGELRWTFSTGGAELARRRQTAEASVRARTERDDARAMVEVDVVSAISRLEAARGRQVVGAAALEYARESQRIIRDRFDAGIAGVDDVLRASTALVDAEARQTAARVDAIVSEAMLDRAVGRTR